MKEFVYAIGDIHGDYGSFKKLLTYFDATLHQLLLIGDLNDRGSLSKECLQLGKSLVEKEGAIYLKGNHEDLLLRFLSEPEARYDHYLRSGGGETINSLLHSGATEEYSASEISHLIKSYYSELITFLTKLPFYYEWQDYLFVHGGVNLNHEDWRQTSEHEFMWIRESFHEGENLTNKQIVFGHTPTLMLYGDNETTSLWQSDGKIGIDGGGIYGGSIHGVVFSGSEIIKDIEIKEGLEVWRPEF